MATAKKKDPIKKGQVYEDKRDDKRTVTIVDRVKGPPASVLGGVQKWQAKSSTTGRVTTIKESTLRSSFRLRATVTSTPTQAA